MLVFLIIFWKSSCFIIKEYSKEKHNDIIKIPFYSEITRRKFYKP